MQKDFWRNSRIAVMGGGSWGTVLANVAAKNCPDIRLWLRDEEQVKSINAARVNIKYLPELVLSDRIHATTSLEKAFDQGIHAVIWALPSGACRIESKKMAGFFKGEEIVLHATKGIEEVSMKRVSQMLAEELPCPRIGVISGPNLAHEVSRGEPAATVVASSFQEVIDAGIALFTTDRFRIYSSNDMVGVEWAGALKNILAIASGTVDALKLGWNTRSMVITRGLAEIVRFGTAMGAKLETFLGLAGMGDLLATCSSPLSRNYRVGQQLAAGKKLSEVLHTLGGVAEGVRTTQIVWNHAKQRGIYMPITEGVYRLTVEGRPAAEVLDFLMSRPSQPDGI